MVGGGGGGEGVGIRLRGLLLIITSGPEDGIPCTLPWDLKVERKI